MNKLDHSQSQCRISMILIVEPQTLVGPFSARWTSLRLSKLSPGKHPITTTEIPHEPLSSFMNRDRKKAISQRIPLEALQVFGRANATNRGSFMTWPLRTYRPFQIPTKLQSYFLAELFASSSQCDEIL